MRKTRGNRRRNRSERPLDSSPGLTRGLRGNERMRLWINLTGMRSRSKRWRDRAMLDPNLRKSLLGWNFRPL